MRTRPRKMMTLALGAALTVAVATGCGGDDGDDGAEETTTTTEAEATTTTEAETTTTVADDDGDADDGGDVEADVEADEVDWARDAVEHRDRVGRRVGYDCPEDGTPSTVWGTGTYTDDSSVCTAAVHAGLITVEDGGRVVIEVAPGQESYEATEANGITSLEYGSWAGSFTFPAADGDAADDGGIGGDAGADDGPVGEDAEDGGSGIGAPLDDEG